MIEKVGSSKLEAERMKTERSEKNCQIVDKRSPEWASEHSPGFSPGYKK
jgi:hypothetical protein